MKKIDFLFFDAGGGPGGRSPGGPYSFRYHQIYWPMFEYDCL
jgi:hypothetical protein